MAMKLSHAVAASVAAVAIASGAGSAPAATIPEVEFNNTTATATALDPANQCYARGSAALDPASDLDLWSFAAAAETLVWAGTDTGGTQVGAPTSRDTVLDVLGVDGTTVIENDDDDGTGNGGDGTVEAGVASLVAGARFPQAGIGFLRIGAFSLGATVNPYRMFVATTTNAPVSEREPNDTSAAANPVLGCDTPINGQINTSGDVDRFSFQLAAGDTVFVALDGDPDRVSATDLTVTLAGPNGADVLGPLDGSSSSKGAAEGFDFDATATGVYTLRVQAASGAPVGGNYRLLVATPDRTAPKVLITGGPSGPTSDARPVFSFSANDDQTAPGVLQLQCSIVPQGQTPAFAGCTAPSFQPPAALGAGAYAFAVRAIDVTGNVGDTETRSFSVTGPGAAGPGGGAPGAGPGGGDSVKPVVRGLAVSVRTTIVKGKNGKPDRRVRLVTVSVRASDAAPGRVAAIDCKLDRGAYKRCTTRTTFRGVANGRHTVVVRVTDAAGNVTTASKSFSLGPKK